MSRGPFSVQTLEFLADLEQHNDRAWFEANRKRYEEHFVAPAKAFVVEVGARIEAAVPGVHAEPRVNGSIFRINRDTRFSKDKRPYKHHLDLMFWVGEGRSRECPGFFFRLMPDGLFVGGGMHGFDKEKLRRFRAAVAADGPGAALDAAAAAVRAAGDYNLGGQTYKRVPRGFEPDHPRAGWLRHSALWADWSASPPPAVDGPEFTETVVDHMVACAPIVRWIHDHVTGP